MNRFKRRIPYISPIKVAIAALYAAIATGIIYTFGGTENEWFIICCGLFAALVCVYFFIVLSVGHRYAYSNNYISFLYFIFQYKKIYYSDFDSIVISNASYNNGNGYGPIGNNPMQYRIKDETGIHKVIYPYISLHKKDFPMEQIASELSSRELFFMDNDNLVCIGICWFDSFAELLMNTSMNVYILEDVYLRFEKTFDEIITKDAKSERRFFIVINEKIPYDKYKEKR